MSFYAWLFLGSLLHFFSPCVSFKQEQFSVKIIEIGEWHLPSTGVMTFYWGWSLPVLSPFYWVFQQMSSPLCPGTSHIPGVWVFLVISLCDDLFILGPRSGTI